MTAVFVLLGDADGLFKKSKDGFIFEYKDGKKEFAIPLKGCAFAIDAIESYSDLEAFEEHANEAAELLREKLVAANKEIEFENRVRNSVVVMKYEPLIEKAGEITRSLVSRGGLDHEQGEKFKKTLYDFIDYMFKK